MTDLAKLTAAEIMHKKLITAGPDQTLDEVRQKMVDSHIGGLPVLIGEKLVGIVSSSDFLRIESLVDALDGEVAAAEHWETSQADGFDHTPSEASRNQRFQGFNDYMQHVRVKDVMRRQIFSVSPGDSIAKVASLMSKNHVHRIVVLDKEKLVGIISSIDLAKLLA